jgi:hypothetical protein
MFAVAVAAVVFGASMQLERRSRRFARLAAIHSLAEMEHFGTWLSFGGDPAPLEDMPPAAQGPVRYLLRSKMLMTYHRALRAKYERAARRPWLPVPPDPPDPK